MRWRKRVVHRLRQKTEERGKGREASKHGPAPECNLWHSKNQQYKVKRVLRRRTEGPRISISLIDLCRHGDACYAGDLAQIHVIQTHRISPRFLPDPTSFVPTQYFSSALGRSSPSISLLPVLNLTPFSSSATRRRGIAAAVPFSVWAKGSGADSDSADRAGL